MQNINVMHNFINNIHHELNFYNQNMHIINNLMCFFMHIAHKMHVRYNYYGGINMGKVKNKIAINLSSKNCTQSELAKKVGVNQSAIARYVRGDVEPSLEVLINLAHALNVTTDELLGVNIKKDTPTEVSNLGTDQRAIQKLAEKLDDVQASQVYNYMLFVIDQKSNRYENYNF